MTVLGLIWRLAVLLLALDVIIPVSTAKLGSHPNPAVSYDDAIARVSRQQTEDDSVVALGGRSIFLTHGKRTPYAVVLFHGLSSSPRQFLPLANQLYAQGDNVYVPRLPEHGKRSGDAGELAHMTAEELRDCADSAVDVAQGLGDSVIVVGLSTGGTLAAWVAQHRNDVGRAVMVSPALELANIPSVLDEPLVNLGLIVPNVTHRSAPDTLQPDHEPGFSSRAIAELLRLGIEVEQAAALGPPKTRHMALLLNPNDHTIKAGPAIALARQWTEDGASVPVYELPDSLHLPHDVIDVSEPGARTDMVYPVLVALVSGHKVPSWVELRPERP